MSEPLAAQPEAPVEVEPGSLAATSNTPDAPVVGTSDVHAPVSAAERDALASAVRVDPELSMVSIDRPVPLSAPTSPGSPAGDYRLVRTRTVQPDYPREAARLGEEGWVDLRLTVAPDGRVADVEVLGAEPRQVFDAAARRAARQWRFEPPREAGIEEPMNAMIRLTFVMD